MENQGGWGTERSRSQKQEQWIPPCSRSHIQAVWVPPKGQTRSWRSQASTPFGREGGTDSVTIHSGSPSLPLFFKGSRHPSITSWNQVPLNLLQCSFCRRSRQWNSTLTYPCICLSSYTWSPSLPLSIYLLTSWCTLQRVSWHPRVPWHPGGISLVNRLNPYTSSEVESIDFFPIFFYFLYLCQQRREGERNPAITRNSI